MGSDDENYAQVCVPASGSTTTARPVARPISGEPLQTSIVNCPVCGRGVPFSEAEKHVNAHYDNPVVPIQRGVGGSTQGKKRKPAEDAGAGVCNLLRWSGHRAADA